MTFVPLPIQLYPVRVPWNRLMNDLRDFGWTPYRVATEAMQVDPPTAYSWEKGSEPRFGYGAALLELHRYVCGNEYSEKLKSEFTPR